jgi:F-box interacting protein
LAPLGFNLDTSADYFYGFGYDQSTDDYLVVSMSSGTNSSYLEFFSLRANAWKEIDEGTRIRYANATEDYRKEGSFFNGAIHWFAYRHQLEKNVIVAFDLMERKLIGMHLPDQFDLEIDYYSGLWVFREFLSLWALSHDNVTVEIWVMKEYRVHSSWTKTYVLPTDDIFTNYFSPLCCTKSGDIVGTYGRYRLVKYNDEGHLLGHVHSYFNHPYRFRVVMYTESRWHKQEDPYKFRVVMYTESLLSLPGDNVQA